MELQGRLRCLAVLSSSPTTADHADVGEARRITTRASCFQGLASPPPMPEANLARGLLSHWSGWLPLHLLLPLEREKERPCRGAALTYLTRRGKGQVVLTGGIWKLTQTADRFCESGVGRTGHWANHRHRRAALWGSFQGSQPRPWFSPENTDLVRGTLPGTPVLQTPSFLHLIRCENASELSPTLASFWML